MNNIEKLNITIDFSDDVKALIKDLRDAIIQNEVNRLRNEMSKIECEKKYYDTWINYCDEEIAKKDFDR